MLQHKQEERELKRYEGDIIKKQHHLRRTMVEYENSKGTLTFSVFKCSRTHNMTALENISTRVDCKNQCFDWRKLIMNMWSRFSHLDTVWHPETTQASVAVTESLNILQKHTDLLVL